MKVVAFNGSPKPAGNTYGALTLVGTELQQAGIDFEIVHIGNKLIRGCTACNGCAKNQDERCVIAGDEVNDAIQKAKAADGILLGSPVYFSGVAGTMKSFLDRLFYVAIANKGLFRHKVGATVVAVRRTGGSATFDCLNHYINYSEMLMPSSNYWNIIHGTVPGEVDQDLEGQQIMRLLGKNMAWLMHLVAAGQAQIPPVTREEKVYTNFIR